MQNYTCIAQKIKDNWYMNNLLTLRNCQAVFQSGCAVLHYHKTLYLFILFLFFYFLKFSHAF